MPNNIERHPVLILERKPQIKSVENNTKIL